MNLKFKGLCAEAGDAGDAGGGGASGSTSLLGGAAGGTSEPSTSWVGADGSFNHDHAPQAWKGNPLLGQLKDVGGLMKAYSDTKEFVGKKFVVPTDKSTPEEWSDFRARMGAPETADGYSRDYKAPDGVDASALGQDGLSDKIATIFHKHGAPKALWNDVFQAFNGHMVEGLQKQTQQADATNVEFEKSQRAELEKAWGQDFDKHSTTVTRVAAMAGLTGDPFEWTPAQVAQAFFTLSAKFSESQIAGSPASNLAMGGKAQADAIMADKSSPYWQPTHPQHKATVAQVNALMKAA